MIPLRVLITNIGVAGRTGTEVYVRDLALGLSARGHAVSVFALIVGRLGAELRAHGIPVVTDVAELPVAPDIIHGHHHAPTMAALSHFRHVPALFVVHDPKSTLDEPPVFPRVLLYAGVDAACQARAAVHVPQVTLVPNSVDLTRFRPRGPLPARPQRALVFASPSSGVKHLDGVRAACGHAGLALDEVGIDKAVDAPEELLGKYDVVFAKARCALEAMAVGCAVVLCSSHGNGPLVTLEQFDDLRGKNFAAAALVRPVSAAALGRELARYDAAEAGRVSERVRATCGLDTMVETWLGIYGEVLALDWKADPDAEGRAMAAYLSRVSLEHQRRMDLLEEATILQRHLLAFQQTGSYRVLRKLFRVPGLGRLLHAIRKRVVDRPPA